MDETPSGKRQEMLDATVRVPDHVVYREFPSETVILNLNTGKYHGVNPTGGRMLDVLRDVGQVSRAAAQLANEYGMPLGDMERDLSEFCTALAERELIEVDSVATG